MNNLATPSHPPNSGTNRERAALPCPNGHADAYRKSASTALACGKTRVGYVRRDGRSTYVRTKHAKTCLALSSKLIGLSQSRPPFCGFASPALVKDQKDAKKASGTRTMQTRPKHSMALMLESITTTPPCGNRKFNRIRLTGP